MSFLSWRGRIVFCPCEQNLTVYFYCLNLFCVKKIGNAFLLFLQVWRMNYISSFIVLFTLQVEVIHVHAIKIIISLHMIKSVKYLGIQFYKKVFSNHFLQQLCTSQIRYCQEAVASVKVVDSCPSSKTEWDAAARKKDCGRMASKQKCTTVEKFQYHCVVNSLRSKLLEVCAPTRIIFGIVFNIII